MTPIALTDEERAACRREGVKRWSQSRNQGRTHMADPRFSHADVLAKDVQGAVGEYAVARFLGLKEALLAAWAAQNEPQRGAPDIDPNHEVKTGSQDHHNLLIPLSGAGLQDRVFWLVIVMDGQPSIVGWATTYGVAKHGQMKEPYKGRPCYFLHRRHLLAPEAYEKLAVAGT